MSYSQKTSPEQQVEDTEDLKEIRRRYDEEGLEFHPDTLDLRYNMFQWMIKQKPIDEKNHNRPLSYMINIDQVFRVKVDNGPKEYLMWHQTEYIQDNNGTERSFDKYDGALPIIKTSKERNATGQIINSSVIARKPEFKMEWSKENFNSLLSKSDFTPTQLIVGMAVDSYPECYTDRREYVYVIKSIDDFRDESYEVLIELALSGMSSSTPSAYLVRDSMDLAKKNRIHHPGIAKRVEIADNNPQKK